MNDRRAPTNNRAKTWRWPLKPETVRSVLSSHSILGLAFAAIIYIVCLTGTVAVFAPDLERWEVPGAPVVTRLSDASASRAIDEAARRAPNDATLYLSMPSSNLAGATLTAFNPTYEHKWGVAVDGSLVDLEAVWTEFLIHLHINLDLPRSWGQFIVGLTGVALLSSLVSGILAHPRVLRDAFHLRLGGSRRLQEADLHNRLGIWALPFHFTLALTGALLGLSTIIVAMLAMLLYRGDMGQVYALFLDPPPKVDASAAPIPDIMQLISDARARAPAAVTDTIMVERPGRADMRISIHGRRPELLTQQDEAQYDAGGRLIRQERPEDLVAGTRMLSGIGQLHFGWFGGLPVRIAYGLLGIALCVVTSSGVTIWLARRRDRGPPAPQWERIWAAICWGQPVILMLTAMLSFAWRGVPLPLTWLGLTLLSVAFASVARAISGPRLASGLRWILAIGILGAALMHAMALLKTGKNSIVDLLLLSCGSCLLFALMRSRSEIRSHRV